MSGFSGTRAACARCPAPLFLWIPAILLAANARAQQDTSVSRDTSHLAAVTVIGTRSDIAERRRELLRVPGSVDLINASELRDTRQANLGDVLKFTPGVFVQPRQGAADESQISIRGSGLRNNFHARGVNLLVNGMPYRNADGFTDFESLELLTTQAVEIYKGGNAMRYGGSTLGGAINFDTETGYTAPSASAFLEGGSHGFAKAQAAGSGVRGGTDWYASYARTSLGGYRNWSGQQRDRVNLHAGQRLGTRGDVRAFYFFAHVQEHLPGSLTLSELNASPTSAFSQNVADQWGRDYVLHHLGLQYRAQLTPTQRIQVSPYLQYRDIDHPIFEVIAQISHDVGAELRYENTEPLFGRDNRLTVGFQPALGTIGNKQFENAAGKHGALTKDELDRATSLALYVENGLALTDRLTATAGVRLERSTRSVDDRFPDDGDQTDALRYDILAPRAGLLLQLSPTTQVFANASRSVEPPLFLELTSFGNTGGFLPLRPQSAWQYELGGRANSLGLTWDAAAYYIALENELLNMNVTPFAGATFTVPTYRNSPRTRHAGVEAGVGLQRWVRLLSRGDVRDMIAARLSYSYSRFTFVEDSAFAGNDIPGAPRHHLAAELTYAHPSGFSVSPSVEWVPSSYFVNSDNSATNAAWTNVSLRAEWNLATLGTTVFAAATNLGNARYSASVQVDNAAGRYYEPADPRSFHAGIRWAP